jgi:hypothetical protein
VSAVWAAIAIVLFWWIGLTSGVAWLPAFMACQPFLWYYGGEARPYAMIIALSSASLCAFSVSLADTDVASPKVGAFLLSGFLLSATHLLAVVPFVVAACVLGLTLVGRGWRPTAKEWGVIVVFVGLFALLAAYYFSTLTGGALTLWDRPWKVVLGSGLFSAYEILGFAGFGPGRYDLRQVALEGGLGGAVRGLLQPSVIGLVILGCLYGIVLIRLTVQTPLRQSRLRLPVVLSCAVVLIGAGILYLYAWYAGHPFWGRHFAAVFPFVVYVVAVAANSGVRPFRGDVNRIALSLGITLLASSLLVRFHPAHTRDDYRSAAHAARTAIQQGERVWWAANPICAEYYQVPICGDDSTYGEECVVDIGNASSADLGAMPTPGMIVLSKPELHDRLGSIQSYIDTRHFVQQKTVLAFAIFRAPLSGERSTF